MRTEVVKIYKFDELPVLTQESILSEFYDINTNHEWWDYIQEDLSMIYCTLCGFDIDRRNYCDIYFRFGQEDTAKEIIKQHGEKCETYKLAKTFLSEYEKSLDAEGQETDTSYELKEEFTKSLQEEYLGILRREYEYLTSEAAIRETILSNGYEFMENGKLWN